MNINMNNCAIDSLEEFGITFVNERSDEYYCIYKETESTYGEGFICNSELNNMIEGNSNLNLDEISMFLEQENIFMEEFINLPFEQKIISVFKYFGPEILFGNNLSPLTRKEALEIVNDLE